MNEPMKSLATVGSRWPRRLAAATLVAAVPLVFFGGSVTTLHAGLAIDGWLVLEPGRGDHFLWLYPLDKWFRDVGTFVEHTHRLLGSLVGLLALATVCATWATDRRRLPRILSLGALLAVVAQGTIGGFRVLERSEDLAFLHGAIGQAVFAVLGASAIALSPAFSAPTPTTSDGSESDGRRLRRLSMAVVAAIYLQIVAGAWLRHGGGLDAMILHLVMAGAVLVLVALLARQMGLAARTLSAESAGSPRVRIQSLRRWVIGSLSAQILLGIAAFVVVSRSQSARAADGLGTAVLPTLHVVGGGILLLACVASSMWAHRVFPAGSRSTPRLVEPELKPDLHARWETAR